MSIDEIIMLIKMLQTRRGSEDAFSVKVYEKGKEYNVAATMGCYFIRKGWAEEV